MSTPLILFGACDRHNFGDLLLAEVAARRAAPRPLIVAGLAERDLSAWGGRPVRAIGALAHAFADTPADVLHVGGEILTCSLYEAAVMLLPAAQAQAAIAAHDRDPAAGERWAQALLGLQQRVAYQVPRRLFRRPRRFVYHGAGGVDLDRVPAALRTEALANLRAADAVVVRDAVTHAHLARAGIRAGLAPDPAELVALLCGAEIAHAAAAGEVAALRARFAAGYLAVQFSADFGDDATLRLLAAQLAAAQAATGLGLVLFRAGLAPWHDDAAVYRRLLGFLPGGSAAVLFDSAVLWDICALLAHAAAYCGSSLHGRIVAAAFARPVLGLARPSPHVGKHAAYAATWDGADGPAVVAPDGLARGLETRLARSGAELASAAAARARQAAGGLPIPAAT